MSILSTIIIITNLCYVAAYDTETRCPAWVAYDLEPGEIIQTNRASISFHADKRVPYTDNTEDYVGTMFDRGHMAPAADFNFDANALKATYSFVNVCPMARSMNRGPWRMAEDKVRSLAESGTVHIVSFPIFKETTNHIGRVRVPDAFVKVAYGSFGATLWVMENK